MCPPRSCGPGSTSSAGGITEAPARAACDATASSRTRSCGSGPSGNGSPVETRATTGAGRRWTRMCHASRSTTGSSERRPCSRATASAAATALSEVCVRSAGCLQVLACRERDALDRVGAARLDRSLGDEVVVVRAHLRDVEACCTQRVEIAFARNRTGDARRPELDVPARPLLQSATAHDVCDRERPVRLQDSRSLREDMVLHRGEIDHAVRDDSVERRILEGKLVDRRVDELDLLEAVAEPQPARLRQLVVGEVDADDAAVRTDLAGGAEDVHPRAGAEVEDVVSRRERGEVEVVADAGERGDGLGGHRVDYVARVSEPKREL